MMMMMTFIIIDYNDKAKQQISAINSNNLNQSINHDLSFKRG